MIAIVDYGVGDLFSLTSSLRAIGADVTVTGRAEVLRQAENLIPPGVGAFGDAADVLRSSGPGQSVHGEAGRGEHLQGIWRGMEWLF